MSRDSLKAQINPHFLYNTLESINFRAKASGDLPDGRIFGKPKEFLLSNQNTTIQDIAVAVGFGNNPRYFSQMFKKEEGMTSSEFILSYKSGAVAPEIKKSRT